MGNEKKKFKFIKSAEIMKEFSQNHAPAVGRITQANLKEISSAGVPIKVVCVEKQNQPLRFIAFIEIDSKKENPQKLVLFNRNKEVKILRSETACKLFFKDLGVDSVTFWSHQKAEKEGCFKELQL